MFYYFFPNKKIAYDISLSLFFFYLEFILQDLIFFQIYVQQQSEMDYSYTCILLIKVVYSKQHLFSNE